jgi:hypothetical protein
MRLDRILQCGAAAALASATLATQACSQAGPDLKPYDQGRFIPFTPWAAGQAPFEAPPTVALRIDGPLGAVTPPPVVMDTGSTGVVISAADLVGWSADRVKTYPRGWEFLSSSKRLWVGHWIPYTVSFLDPSGAELARAKVPILVVDTELNCPGYDVKTSPGTCAAPKATISMPKGIAYMGVGFGREGNGQTQGTPEKNPLLNLSAIDGRPIAPATYRRGYVVTRDGVHVGLTPANSGGFRFVKLGAQGPHGPLDWPQAPMQVAAGGLPAQPGALLIDTGIPTMYLGVADPAALQTRTQTNNNDKAQSKVLADGQAVTITVPTQPATTLAFTTGQGDAIAPTQVLVNSPMPTAFVNTGRRALRGFDVLFDADGGWFGLRPTAP